MRTAAFVGAMTVMAAGSAAAQPYSVVELPCLAGTFRASVADINERLEVVGNCDDEIVVWDRNGVRPIGLRS